METETEEKGEDNDLKREAKDRRERVVGNKYGKWGIDVK